MRKILPILLLAFVVIACSENKKLTKAQSDVEKEKKVITLNKSEFKTKIFNFEAQNIDDWKYEGKEPAIIDFYATWCGPCKQMAPILEQLATEYQGKIKVYKVDIDKEQELAVLFNINSIPSLLFIPQKEKPQMMVGLLPETQLKEIIDTLLLK